MEQVLLYSGVSSSSSWRVRICLALKGIKHKTIWKDSTKSGPALDVNSMGQVPVLMIDSRKLIQSVAICEYLEETRPTGLLPPLDQPYRRAQVRHVVEIINSGIQPLQNAPIVASIAKGDAAKHKEWIHSVIHKGLQSLENIAAANNSHDLLFDWATQPTLAEVFLVPQVENARRYEINVAENYPRLNRVVNYLFNTYETFSSTRPPSMDVLKSKI